MSLLLTSGYWNLRLEMAQVSAAVLGPFVMLSELPPRMRRKALSKKGSQHHSHTFPLMSYTPNSLGSLLPTAFVSHGELPQYQPTKFKSLLPEYV